MPYSNMSELPEAVKALPEHAQTIWMSAFNASYEQYGEEKAFAIAWSAVEKAGYKKEGDKWVKAAVDDFPLKIHYSGIQLRSSIKETEGYSWRVRVVASGTDYNGLTWTEDVLKSSIDKFEGAKVFMLSESQQRPRRLKV